jgi:hypothetical protein
MEDVAWDRSLSGDMRTSSASPVGDDPDQPFVDDERASVFFEKSKWFSNFRLFERVVLIGDDRFRSFDAETVVVTARLFEEFRASLVDEDDPFGKSGA